MKVELLVTAPVITPALAVRVPELETVPETVPVVVKVPLFVRLPEIVPEFVTVAPDLTLRAEAIAPVLLIIFSKYVVPEPETD